MLLLAAAPTVASSLMKVNVRALDADADANADVLFRCFAPFSLGLWVLENGVVLAVVVIAIAIVIAVVAFGL